MLSTAVTAGEISITIVEKKQRPVHDTVVELVSNTANTMNAGNVEITQLDKEFAPQMSVVPRGSPVLFTNKDPIQHHVYSVSKGNQFDLPLYQGTPSERIKFDRPGVVKLGCNIHDWMLGFAYVSQSKYVLTTDASGIARFKDIPEGDYELRIWNPRLKKNNKVISQRLTLKKDQPLEQTVTLSLRKKVRKPPRIDKSNYEG